MAGLCGREGVGELNRLNVVSRLTAAASQRETRRSPPTAQLITRAMPSIQLDSVAADAEWNRSKMSICWPGVRRGEGAAKGERDRADIRSDRSIGKVIG